MKISIVSRTFEDENEIKKDIEEFSKSFGLVYNFVNENPDFVISYGGDGTFLIGERKFPGVPKILVKKSKTCKKCHELHIKEILKKIINKEYRIKEIPKIKANLKNSFDKELIAVNDIVIRNTLPTEAIRFKVFIDEKEIGMYIGDGVVIATPFGSTAYFHSITRKSFEEGLGIAFNNTTEIVEPKILDENSEIFIEILRGPAVLVADNNRNFIDLKENDVVIIKKIEEKAKIVVFD